MSLQVVRGRDDLSVSAVKALKAQCKDGFALREKLNVHIVPPDRKVVRPLRFMVNRSVREALAYDENHPLYVPYVGFCF